MQIPLLALSAIIPSLLLMWFFHSRDIFPEPHRVLWTAFFLGVGVVIPVVGVAYPVQVWLGRFADPYLQGASDAFLLAAIPEEAFKLLALYLFCIRHREFNEPMDGVVYGVATSLGFATIENCLYVFHGGLPVAVTRAVTSVPCHAFLGAIMGYYAGQAYFFPEARKRFAMLAFLVPMGLHGLYDFPLLSARAFADNFGASGTQIHPALIAVMPLTLLFACLQALMSTRELRWEQRLLLARGLEPLHLPDPRVRRQSSVKGWVSILVGGGAATSGGVLVLVAATIWNQRLVDLDTYRSMILGGLVLGIAVLGIGTVQFLFGVRVLNRRDEATRRAAEIVDEPGDAVTTSGG